MTMKNIFIALLTIALLAVSSVAFATEFSFGDILFASSLILAVKENDLDEVKKLLNHPETDVNDADDDDGYTALMYASSLGYIEIVQVLLDYRDANDGGVWVDETNNEGITALMLAAEQHYLSDTEHYINIVKLLLDDRANGGDDLIMLMKWETEYLEDVKIGIATVLLDCGVDVNYTDTDNNTALIVVADSEHSNLATTLLDKGANINYSNENNGDTALIVASRNNRLEVVTALLDGTDVNVNHRNIHDKTAFGVADINEIKEILIDHGATE